MSNNPIGVFDSGVGGLCVLRKCSAALPHEHFVYLADSANMPYGERSAADIKRAACACAETLFDMNCKAVVVACNTATETAISDIRSLYPDKIVVGLEPAVKPCRAELDSGYAVALVTPATARSEKFGRLMRSCDGRIVPSPQPHLAATIERLIGEPSALRPIVRDILQPYKDARAVVLGCSHYTYLTALIDEFYGGNVKIYDGAGGAALRLKCLLEKADLCASGGEVGSVRFYSTYKLNEELRMKN